MLEIHGLTKRYNGIAAIDGVSFSIRPREILGYLGPNGAGKSTLMNVLAGMYRPEAGEIRRDVDRPQDGRKPVIRDDQDIRAGAETAAVEFSQDQPEVVIAAFDRRERLGRSGAIGMLRTVGLGQPQEGEVRDTIPPQYVEQGGSGPRVAADFVFGVGGWTVGGREGPKGRGEGGLQPRWHGGALVNDR